MSRTCMCWGFECSDGWFHIIDNLSFRITHICKNTKTDSTYLITISNNETEGRAIWIDNYDQLVGEDTNSILLPIHYKATFKHTTEISRFMKVHFGAPSCVKVSYEEVQKEIDNQTEELTGQKAFR